MLTGNKLHTADIILEETDPTIQKEILKDYVLNEDVTCIVAFSGGKDSVAMVLQLIEMGVPKHRIELWHHEVDGNSGNFFDWACTHSYCQAFAETLGIKILFSYREGGIIQEIYKKDSLSGDVLFQEIEGGEFVRTITKGSPNTRLRFPAVAADLRTRWCSGHVKIDVMCRAINNIARYKEANIVVFSGERRAESTARSKYKEVEKYRSYSQKRKAIQWRSIIDWTDAEVWGIMEKWKIQPHPCYMLGWSRCSCQTCIFSSSNTWATIKELDPAKFDIFVNVEKEINFTMYSGINLVDKSNKGVSFLVPEVVERWKNEALNEFKSPIFVDEWVLPQGALSKETSGSL